ncbi:MAG: acyl-CoA dehydratase activase [Clostridia bacterium]|nr:acyl-CoA dehydratase activase [Clostridia bacterium]
MIGYVCRYTPYEIFEFFGQDFEKIAPNMQHTPLSDAKFHKNMCSYSKGVLELCLQGHYDAIVLTNCCDSIRRIYDVIKEAMPNQWVYMMELPRKKTREAAAFWQSEIEELIIALEKKFDKKFNWDHFNNFINEKKTTEKSKDNNEKILLLGAQLTKDAYDILANKTKFDDRTCSKTDDVRSFKSNTYAAALLNQLPCFRMQNFWDTLEDDITNNNPPGIIYHTLKFCDYYAYGYAYLKDKYKGELLKIETDYLAKQKGQISTRLDAFLEMISVKKEKRYETNSQKKKLFLGIDSGSTSTNVVIMDEQKKILSYHIVATGAKSIISAQRAYQDILSKADISEKDITYAVATGYGRDFISFSDQSVTEISCHGRGAYFFNASVKTIIDIGGQDSKVIQTNEKGEVKDFVMNDKCAAGTGRFLEMMSKTLESPLEEMGNMAPSRKEPIEITSMCTVFAESEVISLIAENKEKADIVSAIHRSMAQRSASMVERVGKQKGYMMTGGVAKNKGIVHSIETYLNEKLVIPQEPQIIGAVGACLFAMDSYDKGTKASQEDVSNIG